MKRARVQPAELTTTAGSGDPPSPFAQLLRRVSDVAWRILAVALAVLAGGYGVARLWFVVLPVFVALLICAFLVPAVTWLERRRWPPLAATWSVFGGFLAGVVAVGLLVVPAVAEEFAGLGPTLSAGVSSVERWLVEGPLGLEPEQLARYRELAADRIGEILRSSTGGLVAGALAVVEFAAALVLAVVLGFFFVKDGRRLQHWALCHLPPRRHELVSAVAHRAWAALGGYLRGVVLIGLVEATIIGITLWLVGAQLVLPTAALTFAGAFFPLVGAVIAGIVASLVALVGGGLGDALVVAAVVVVVQQFDTDLLAPVVYGRAVNLHPAVVLISLSAGAALGGITGAFFAVPVAAVVAAVGDELWNRYGEAWCTSTLEPD